MKQMLRLVQRVWSWRGAWGAAALALGIYGTLFHVYEEALPDRFNVNWHKQRAFGSDSVWILHQFKLRDTYTHNDHLLYHVMARLRYAAKADLREPHQPAIRAHKGLSVFAGAAAASLLVGGGWCMTRHLSASLAAALFCAGGAGWLFFSSAIETYMPHVVWSVLAMLAALGYARCRTPVRGAWLGACLGMAFLMRTDAFLLAPLLLVWATPPGYGRRWTNALACILMAAVIGLGGYALLAHSFYDVPFKEVPAWALGFHQRSRFGIELGTGGNLTRLNVCRVAANHLVYGVVFPGLWRTQETNVMSAFGRSGGSFLVPTAYLLVFALLCAGAGQGLRRTETRRESALWLGIVAAWFILRIGFYTWWAPKEPFLFAVMSLPGLWLLTMAYVRGLSPWPGSDDPMRLPWARRLWTLPLWGMAVLVWWHNWQSLILPLRGN